MWIDLGIWIKLEHLGRSMYWKQILSIVNLKMRKRSGLNLLLRKYFLGKRSIHTPV